VQAVGQRAARRCTRGAVTIGAAAWAQNGGDDTLPSEGRFGSAPALRRDADPAVAPLTAHTRRTASVILADRSLFPG
jgi:hypothetical protein